MNFLEKIKVITSISPNILIKKIIRRFKNRNKFKKINKLIRSNPTFEQYDLDGIDYNSFLISISKITNELGIWNFLETNDNFVLNLAERIMHHQFNLLGSDWQRISFDSDYKGYFDILYTDKLKVSSLDFVKNYILSPNRAYSLHLLEKLPKNYNLIDWQRDFRTGYRWYEKVASNQIEFNQDNGADIKNPWELGRMQHLNILFYAWKLTKNEKYSNEFCNQILDFILSNPPNMGVQWLSNMDVSIRAVNLIITYSLFRNENYQFDEEFERIFLNSIVTHIHFVYNNREWSDGLRANHYFSNISALLILCIFLNSDNYSKYFDFAQKELRNEVFYQFYRDGGNFEQSLNYHYFVNEMLIYPLLIIKNIDKINYNFDKKDYFDGMSQRLDAIFHFSYNNLNLLNYECDNYGDNDSGYFYRFYPPFDLVTYRPNIGNRRELLQLNKLFGDVDYERVASFPDFGIYKLKGCEMLLNFYCAKFSKNTRGSHQHNDNLSFTLSKNNIDFIIDSGTMNYTAFPVIRNRFRSIEMHNTVQLGEMEQNIIPRDRNYLFWLYENGQSMIEGYTDESIEASHNYFRTKYLRKITYNDNVFEIEETINDNGNKTLRLMLHPEVEIVEANNIIILQRDSEKIKIDFNIHRYIIEKVEISLNYGEIVKTSLILVKYKDAIFRWKIY